MPSVELAIPRRDLLSAVSRLSKLAKKSQLAKSELVLDFTSDSVTLTLAGTKVALPAKCDGSGRVVVSGLAFEALTAGARGLGTTDVPVRIDDKMLHVGMVGLSCRWVEERPAPILLPLNASLLDVLELRYGYSQDEIVAAGLEKTLFEAEEHKAILVSNAAFTLSPLGISRVALAHFVDRTLRENKESASDRHRQGAQDE